MRLNGDLLVDDDITADTVQANSLGSTPLNASNLTSGMVPPERLPAAPVNIARTDQENSFTVEQNITGGSGTAYNTAPLEIQMASNPRVAFHWPAVVASQIGMDSAGTIRTFDNPGTGFAPFACGALAAGAITAPRIVTSAAGNNLADLTVSGATNFTNGVALSGGNLNLGPGSLVGGGTLQPTGVVYPGRADVAGAQASWYLGSHAAYGLYTNTGLYVASNLWTAGGAIISGAASVGTDLNVGTTIRAGQGVYERGRGPAMGDWTVGGVASFGFTVSSYDHAYMMIGGTVWLAVNIYAGGPGVSIDVLNIYHSWTAARRTGVATGELTVAGQYFHGSLTVMGNSNLIELRRSDRQAFPAGQMYVFFVVPIALN